MVPKEVFMVESLVEIFINGNSIPYRPFNEDEMYAVDDGRISMHRLYKRRISEGKTPGFKPNTYRHMHVHLLESPQAGDNVTYSELPDNVEQLWVRWPSPHGGRFEMPLNRP